MFKATFWWNFALIVFFIITVALGITLYVFYQMNAETLMRLQALSDEESIKEGELIICDNDLKDFIKRIDHNKDTVKTVQNLVDEHTEVMKKFASNFPEKIWSYPSILAYLANQLLIQGYTEEAIKQDHADMENFNNNRNAHSEVAINAVKEHTSKFEKDKVAFTKVLNDFDKELSKKKDDLNQVVSKHGTEVDTIIKKLNSDLAKTNEDIKVQMVNNIKTRQQLAKTHTRTAEKPNGKIQYVSAAQGKATIDLGSADNIPLSATFSVYSRSETDLKNGKKKGSIQVAQITGLHNSECIVTSDDPSDPILPGDLIYSPVIGDRHFAIAGFIDMDNNGINDVERLVKLLESNGAVVDGYQNEDKQVRRLEETTDFLIIGKRPDESAREEERLTFTNFTKAAHDFNTPQITLDKLLQEMGINSGKSSVIQGGVDSSPIPYTKSNYSGGNVSGLYLEDRNNENNDN